MAIHEIIQLGVKGGDLILKQFAKINKEKEKFKTPAQTKVGAGFPSRVPPGTETKEDEFLNKFGNILKKFKKPELIPPEGEKPEDKEEKNLKDQIANKSRKVADGLNNLAASATSLDPTRFTSGLIDAVGDMTSKFASSIPVVGGFLSAMGGYATEMTKMSSGMAANSLSMIKNAQSVAIDTMEKRGRAAYFGGGTLQNKGYALAERSGIVESIASKYGKFVGSNLEKSVNRLFANNPDIEQATAVAGGNFRALGTDKGYFLQQISDSLGNLPPSMSQELQSQLLDTIQPQELNKDLAAGYRQTRATFDEQDRNTQKTIAGMTKNSQELNEQLNQLSVNLAKGGSALVGSIETLTKQINYVISKISASQQGVKAR